MDASLTDPTDLGCVPGEPPGGSPLARPMSRRRGLSLLAGGASALVGGLSTACGWLAPIPCHLGEPECCNLATCVPCDHVGTKDQYTCQEGHVPTHWTCITETNQVAVCGECNPGPSCFTGPFSCSTWYYAAV